MSVIIPSQFEISKFSFNKEPKAPIGKVGIKQSFSAYGPSKKNLTMQTPYMWAPFGVSTHEDPTSSKIEKYTVQLSFGKEQERKPELKALFKAFQDIDEYAKQLALENSVQFFGKKKTMEQLSAIYHPIVQYAVDKETGERSEQYPPRFKAKIPFDKKENRILVPIFDVNKDTFDLINGIGRTKGSEFQLVLTVSSLWIGTTGFGVTIKAEKMLIKFRAGLSTHEMIDLDDDADKRNSAFKNKAFDKFDNDDSDDNDSKPVQLQEQTFKEDSSDDDDDDDTEDDVKPKKAVAKSRAKK
jgi:hypothetical protein